MSNWDWPQYVIAAMYALNVLAASGLHGKPRTGKFNGPVTALNSALGAWILYMGSFWS